MSDRKPISLVDLRIYEILWDFRGVVRIMVKPNVKMLLEDAEDYIEASKVIRAHIGMRVPVIMKISGFSSMSSEAKAALRAFDFSEIYTAKAICASDVYQRAIISFMIRLIGGQNYLVKVFSDESKGLKWVLSKSEEAMRQLKQKDNDIMKLHDVLNGLTLHHIVE